MFGQPLRNFSMRRFIYENAKKNPQIFATEVRVCLHLLDHAVYSFASSSVPSVRLSVRRPCSSMRAADLLVLVQIYVLNL